MENAFAILSLMTLSFLLGCVITYCLFSYKYFERRSRRLTTERQQPFLNEGLSYLEDRRNRESTISSAAPSHAPSLATSRTPSIAPSVAPSLAPPSPPAPSLSSFPSVPNNRQNEFSLPNVPETIAAVTHC